MASVVAQAYNRGLGVEPPVKSRGKVPGQGIRGTNLVKLKVFWQFCAEFPLKCSVSFEYFLSCCM